MAVQPGHRTVSALLLAACAGSGLVGCGGGAAKTGTVEFRFAISDSARTSDKLKDPLLGSVYGNVFLAEDVGITGPRDNAMRFQDVEVASVDLRTAMTSAANFVSKGLQPGSYVFLGFFDVDGNGAVSHDVDTGDPATLALTNKFEIVADQQAKRLVLFELIYN